ncbi:MAG: DsbA family oxidoreductase, partial [Burkholderiales bacterium]|nr:DsbA family oxidoreductase [Burkholderiales bacterium]
MKIDFVSDVACPWCAIGLGALERALEAIGPEIPVELHFQPFELNPTLAAGGADAAAYLKAKYGMSDEQLAQNRATLRERGAAVGFEFGDRLRVWNTFDAHRLLHWAGLQGAERQRALKHALLRAYHGEGRDIGDAAVLAEVAAGAGLDA